MEQVDLYMEHPPEKFRTFTKLCFFLLMKVIPHYVQLRPSDFCSAYDGGPLEKSELREARLNSRRWGRRPQRGPSMIERRDTHEARLYSRRSGLVAPEGPIYDRKKDTHEARLYSRRSGLTAPKGPVYDRKMRHTVSSVKFAVFRVRIDDSVPRWF